MNHDAVFWDVGGVIFDIDTIALAQVEFVADAVERYDLEKTEEEALEVWRDAMRGHFAGREGRKYRTAREGRRKAAEALFDGDPPADWEAAYEERAREAIEANDGVEETIRRLHEAGVYQGIVSDADVGLADRLDRFGLTDYLDDVTTSEEVGYVKPDSRMFETAFEKARAAGVDPQAGIMVGDKYDNDMEGAAAVGLATAAFGVGDEGPAVDHRLGEIPDLLGIVGVADEA